MIAKLSRQQRLVLEVMEGNPSGTSGFTFVHSGVLCYTKRIQELRDLGYDIETTPPGKYRYYILRGEPKSK